MTEGKPTVLATEEGWSGEVGNIANMPIRIEQTKHSIPIKRIFEKDVPVVIKDLITSHHRLQSTTPLDLQSMLADLAQNPIHRLPNRKRRKKHKTSQKKKQQNSNNKRRRSGKDPRLNRKSKQTIDIKEHQDLQSMLVELRRNPIRRLADRVAIAPDTAVQVKNSTRTMGKIRDTQNSDIKKRLDKLANRIILAQTLKKTQCQRAQQRKLQKRSRRTEQEHVIQKHEREVNKVRKIVKEYATERKGMDRWLRQSPHPANNQLGNNNKTKNKRKRQITLDKWFTASIEKCSKLTPIRILPPRVVSHKAPEHQTQTKPTPPEKQSTSNKDTSFLKPKVKLADKIRIASLNCPGIAAITESGRKKCRTLRMYCKQHHIDVLALQETHTIDELSTLSSFFKFKTYCSKVSSSTVGVAFIIFNPKVKVTKHMDAQDGRMYSITIQYKSRIITLVNIYAPMSKDQQQRFFIHHIGLWDPAHPIMFLGDWNFVEHPQEDTRGRDRVMTQTSSQSFQYLHDFYNLIDMTAIKHSTIQMTRWDVEHSSGARLDRIYVSSRMSQWVIATHNEAIPCTLNTSARHTISDHNIVAVTLSASNTPKGEGYWKLNTQILKSVKLQHKILELIGNFLKDKSEKHSLFTKYETLKGNIQTTLKEWSKERAKQIHKKKDELKQSIKKYTQIIEDVQQKQIWKVTATELLKTRKAMAVIQQEEAQGAWIRSRAKWDYQADKSTKMYFNLERSYSSKKSINSIRAQNGELTTNPQEITKEFRQFYRSLYAHKPIHLGKLEILLENLSLNTDLMNDKHITRMVNCEEIRKAINDTKRGSSPGPDGMPIEFYKTFPIYWAMVLEQIYQEIDKRGRIPTSMSESFIVLLPKPSKDPQNVANWRPISLLNSDYKILTKVWANRMNSVLQQGIGPHQTGFIPGRDIRENILLTQTIIDRMVKQNSPGGILLIDWSKAYDRISHQAIWAVAEKIGMPKHGQQFLKAIYRDPVSWILCNGFMSHVIKVASGVRQGCPLSPQIFTLVAELYNQRLIKDKHIQGFKMNDKCCVKVISYADDTAIPFTTIKDAIRCIKILMLYEEATASKVNTTKTCFVACQHNSHINKYMQKKGYTIRLPGTNTRYLGIPIGVKPNYNLTWDKLERTVASELQMWHKICTTIYGRAIILKSKGLGQLWFVTSLLPINKHATQSIKIIQKECTKFFWGYKGHKLRYSNLMGVPHDGGFKLWDLQDKIISLQTKWMTKFEDPNNKALWKINIAQILNNHQIKYRLPIPHTHSTSDVLPRLNSPMVENLLRHWKRILDRTPIHLEKDEWMASISEQEIPQYVYRLRHTHHWNKGQDQQLKKKQKVPKLDLLWYKDNDTRKTLVVVKEYAHALVPVKVKMVEGVIIEATAIFPPIQFMKLAPNRNIQLISAMSNQDYYVARRSLTPTEKKKVYKWPDITDNMLKQAFISNHRGNESASIRQTRWLILTHSLPVGSRLHKMNRQVAKYCPSCQSKETIRHCIYTCEKSKRIWRWFINVWGNITTDCLPNIHNNEWICNSIESEHPTQLREVCNIITHCIWINRNKKIFNTREALDTQAMIHNIATRWNIHIRAQIHIIKMRHEQAIYYGRTFPAEVGWQILWQRILAIKSDSNDWALLQATTGDTHCAALLYNTDEQYTRPSIIDQDKSIFGFNYQPKFRYKQMQQQIMKTQNQMKENDESEDSTLAI